MGLTGIERLERLCGDPAPWNVGGVFVEIGAGDVLGIASQIKAERAADLAARDEAVRAKNLEIERLRLELERGRELSDEDRALVERLRALGPMPSFGELCAAVAGAPNFTYRTVRDRLVELIERGGGQRDEASINREFPADQAEKLGDALGKLRAGLAADWAESQGGLCVVRDRMRLYAKALDEFDSMLAGDGQSCFSGGIPIDEAEELLDAMRDELDKRLMPEGCRWPKFPDGEKVGKGDLFVDDALEHTAEVDSVLIGMAGNSTLLGAGDAAQYSPDGRSRRSVSAVRLSDGATACVGSHVWLTESGEEAIGPRPQPMTVRSIADDGSVGLHDAEEAEDAACWWLSGDDLASEPPESVADIFKEIEEWLFESGAPVYRWVKRFGAAKRREKEGQ